VTASARDRFGTARAVAARSVEHFAFHAPSRPLGPARQRSTGRTPSLTLAFPKSAATRSPWRAASKDLAAQPFAAGPRSERYASGPERTGHSSHRPGAARRRSTSTSFGAHPSTASAPPDRFAPDADPTDALLLRIEPDHTPSAVPTPAEHGALA
jgi:hypothetical protein